MKIINKALGRGQKGVIGIVIGILFAGAVLKSEAQVTNLSAPGTSIQISLGGANPGISDWLVDGINQLNYQWFYYSVGAGTVNSIDTISPWTAPTFVNSQPNPFLTETYANSTLSVKTTYQLQGASALSGRAGLETTINLENLSGAAQTFHLYQYSDFDLGNVLGNQTVQFAGTGTPYQVTQFGTSGGQMVGTISALGATVEEMAGLEGTNLLGLFPGSPAPVYNDSSLSAGPGGQVAYAYEIDITLNPDQSLTLSELQTVPEPSTTALIFLGMSAFGLYYGRKLVSLKKIVNRTSL
jgi:hypothetical protein